MGTGIVQFRVEAFDERFNWNFDRKFKWEL